jgi:HlyD family type I secretion membrane fusion protein
MARGTQKEIAPFMTVDPPNVIARGLSYILIALFVTAVLLAFIVRLPETVSCPFVLLPVRGTDPIRALYDGTVTDVKAQEGQLVAKGAPIFAMRSDSVVDRASEYKSLDTRRRGAVESLENARKRYDSQTRTDQQEIAGLRKRNEYLGRMIQLKKDGLALMKEKLERYKKLFETGIASHTDYSDQQLEVTKTASELEELQREVGDNELSIQKLENGLATRRVEFEESKHSWDQEIERTSTRMEMLKSSQDQQTGDNLMIPASCSGSVLRLRVTAPGAVVQDGDILAEVVCSDERLQAELNVSQAGVGRIKTGQNVKLLYDSFPFQRYGVKSGDVRWISPAAISMKEQAIFRVLVDLHEDSVVVQGQRRPLLPGMGGLAEIVVGRRSIISYAFEPIRQLRESIK